MNEFLKTLQNAAKEYDVVCEEMAAKNRELNAIVERKIDCRNKVFEACFAPLKGRNPKKGDYVLNLSNGHTTLIHRYIGVSGGYFSFRRCGEYVTDLWVESLKNYLVFPNQVDAISFWEKYSKHLNLQ